MEWYARCGPSPGTLLFGGVAYSRIVDVYIQNLHCMCVLVLIGIFGEHKLPPNQSKSVL